MAFSCTDVDDSPNHIYNPTSYKDNPLLNMHFFSFCICTPASLSEALYKWSVYILLKASVRKCATVRILWTSEFAIRYRNQIGMVKELLYETPPSSYLVLNVTVVIEHVFDYLVYALHQAAPVLFALSMPFLTGSKPGTPLPSSSWKVRFCVLFPYSLVPCHKLSPTTQTSFSSFQSHQFLILVVTSLATDVNSTTFTTQLWWHGQTLYFVVSYSVLTYLLHFSVYISCMTTLFRVPRPTQI